MSVIDDFLSRYPAGSKLDVDGFPAEQPYQCFDAAIVYTRMVANDGSVYIRCKSSGYVKDWWNDFATNGLSQWFTQVPWNAQGQRGDIAIWGNTPQAPLSHIAILLADKGSVENIYGQNQPYPYTNIRDFSSTGLLGYLRPKENIIMDKITREQEQVLSLMAVGSYPGVDYDYRFTGLDNTQANIDALTQFWQAQADGPNGLGTDLKTVQIQNADLTAANIDLSNKLTIDESTIVSQKKTIDDLTKELADIKQDASTTPVTPIGTKPTDPVETPSWFKNFINTLAQKLSEIFTKGK